MKQSRKKRGAPPPPPEPLDAAQSAVAILASVTDFEPKYLPKTNVVRKLRTLKLRVERKP